MLTPFARTPFDLVRLPALFHDAFSEASAESPDSVPAALDLQETESGYALSFDLPGVREDAVELSIHDDVVSLRAERSAPAERPEGTKMLRAERSTAVFERRFRLPRAVNAEGVEARLEHGVLHVSLPLAAHATPRKVPVLSASKTEV